MRKIFVLVLALIMIISLAACSSSVTSPENESEQTPESVNSNTEAPDVSIDEPIGTEEIDVSDAIDFEERNEIVYVYGTNTLNVRKEPSASSEKMGEMKENEQVTRIGYNEKWSKISYYGNEYYASSDYLTTHAPLEFEDKTDTVYVTAEGTLNLRAKPSANSDVIAYPSYGTALDRTGIATTADEFETVWSRILYNGQVCYTNTKYLSLEQPTNDFSTIDETVYVVNSVESLNLRAKPSLNGNVVQAVSSGTPLNRIGVAVKADDDGIVWSKIIYNGVTCYASSSYLTTESPEAAEDTTAETVSENAER